MLETNKLMSESEIKTLLEDIISVYETGYRTNDLDTEVEKWSQIQILRWILE